ncbi:MAG: NADH-quinone oxidoreductase subunit C [Acidilobaceae archaeon]
MVSNVDRVLSGLAIRVGEVKPRRPVYLVKPGDLREAYRRLLEFFGSENIYLSTIAATDKPEENVIEVNYFINILSERVVIVLRCRLERSDPRVPSLVEFTGMHSGEIETHDLVGVVFEGNPYLKRGAFVPEELVERNEYPLRKR